MQGEMLDFTCYKLIVALGNPDREYENTYHNAGRIALERLLAGKELKFRQAGARPFIYAKSGDTVYIEPTTYMNESGPAVRAALDYFKLPSKEMIVLHDDSDLPLGTAKVSFGQSSAGHKGVESIIQTLGTNEFHRLRIGIRSKPGKAGAFVLQPMPQQDKELIYGAIEGTGAAEGL